MNTELINTKSRYNYMPLVKKMILCHFGAAIMGIMISFSNNTYLNIFTALLSFAFYMYILYTSVWDIGAKDKLAIDGKRMAADKLVGLKENVIIGKLIPAGTGMKRYKNIKLDYGVNQEIMDNYEREQERLRYEAEVKENMADEAEDQADENEDIVIVETEAEPEAEEVVELE